MGIPITDLKRRLYEKILNLKKASIIAIVGHFLPVCFVFFFSDTIRFESFSIPRLSTVIIKSQGCTLNSQEPTKLSEIFLIPR